MRLKGAIEQVEAYKTSEQNKSHLQKLLKGLSSELSVIRGVAEAEIAAKLVA